MGQAEEPSGHAAAELAAAASVDDRPQPNLPLLEALVAHSPVSSVTLSDNGTYVAALVRKGDDQRLAVWNPDEGIDLGVITELTREDVRWMSWVGPSVLLICRQDESIWTFNAQVAVLRPLLDADQANRTGVSLVSSVANDNDRILMQWSSGSRASYPGVYRVDLSSGEITEMETPRQPVFIWWGTRDGDIVLGTGIAGRKKMLFVRDDGIGGNTDVLEGQSFKPAADEMRWRKLVEWDVFDDPYFEVQHVNPDGKTAIVLSAHDSDTAELWRYDLTNGKYLSRLASDQTYDIAGAIIDPASGAYAGVHLRTFGPEQRLGQPAWQQYQAAIEAAIKEPGIRFIGGSRDGRYLVVRTQPIHTHPRYYRLNRRTLEIVPFWPYEQNTSPLLAANAILQTEVWIDRAVSERRKRGDMVRRPMQAILTTASGQKSDKAVVLIHGGPVKRVQSQFNPLVSWLALNGYTVLQPNFIGSSGYGESWRRAGYGEWGGRMQRDVRIALMWMHENGYASTDSLCVAGGSYGGYAALMSAAVDSDLITCAASYNGVTSVPLLLEYLATGRFSMQTLPRIRGKNSDRKLRHLSPIAVAKDIKVPVLMLHATLDQNVPYVQGRLMADILNRRDKDHTFITLEGAGHTLIRAQDRRVYFGELLDFLNQYTNESPENP
ncbi:peptidase S9 [Kordiimonas sediminis]|uniref:Peptidase S9 n=1 Tax=Kordiimonas sediminis TaxID=1735581 RepID=A0A919E3X0_9PROT|nr:prolyl oligopeptidase family serine peptidase [Kordiimonas sediminis]GHF11371.1 peptidase S9 [Kordiimonas sediminis]